MTDWFTGFNFTELDMTSPNRTVRTYHAISEAFKHSYARRTELGDEQFVDMVKVCTITSAMLSA